MWLKTIEKNSLCKQKNVRLPKSKENTVLAKRKVPNVWPVYEQISRKHQSDACFTKCMISIYISLLLLSVELI